MSLDVELIPLLSLNEEEFSQLKVVPGYYEALRIRSFLVQTSASLSEKLAGLPEKRSKELFGVSKPPVGQMIAALAYVEIFGFKTEALRGHLIPFYSLVGLKDDALSVSFSFWMQRR